MLRLKNIVKEYVTGDTTVKALKGVSINFRKNEFVSILGHSGCGKTTLLNIIGGLDQYTSGELVIKGRSTKKYKDRDWDTYRNHSIGFVFQSYNLIMHQTVLQNVELALTLSGVSKSERRRRAKEVLEKVGLGNQINKKPNQMSGGQMQRVAIARALINDPEILLADEPTGALDTETSVQIMDLLKEIAQDRLVIMVTHNPELAEQYSTRIVKLLDGEIKDDSMPYTDEEADKEKYDAEDEKGKKRMSYLTALNLSFNNLLTKKGRTILTAFAGSIGIIGIALILSLSDGFNNYIKGVEEDTLSTYPLQITDESIDMSGMMSMMLGSNMESDEEHELDKVYSNNFVGDYMNTMLGEVKINDMISFKDYLENGDGKRIDDYVSDITYDYGITVNAYRSDTSSELFRVNPSVVMDSIGFGSMSEMSSSMSMGTNTGVDCWSEMISNRELLQSQYDVIAGHWPENDNEVVIVVNSKNELTDYELYTLGIRDISEIQQMVMAAFRGEALTFENTSYTYDELLNLEFKVIPSSDYYAYDEETGLYVDKSTDAQYMKDKIDNGIEVKVAGILRPNENAAVRSITTTVAYTHGLVELLMNEAKESEIGKAQIDNPEINVFTGEKFADENAEAGMTDTMTPEAGKGTGIVGAIISGAGAGDKSPTASVGDAMPTASAGDAMPGAGAGDAMPGAGSVDMSGSVSISDMNSVANADYEDILIKLGIAYENDPKIISIYPKDFEAKEEIIDIIEEYNEMVIAAGEDDKEISYTDLVGTMMSSISTIVNAISYILMAFVAISLIVSSIMIGIITYISVLERTKEIGVLRSIGASKKDISRVFNAETIIVGFVAGVIGIGVTVLLNIPINMVIKHLAGLSGVAKLPVAGGVALIFISVILTSIAGLAPARYASKKDPVVALRSE